MDEHARGMRPADHRVGIRHAPRQVGPRAPVPIARQVAAEAPDSVSQGDARGNRVHDFGPRQSVTPNEEAHADDAADQAAVPHEARAGEHQRPRIDEKVEPVAENEQHPGADQAANGAHTTSPEDRDESYP